MFHVDDSVAAQKMYDVYVVHCSTRYHSLQVQPSTGCTNLAQRVMYVTQLTDRQTDRQIDKQTRRLKL